MRYHVMKHFIIGMICLLIPIYLTGCGSDSKESASTESAKNADNSSIIFWNQTGTEGTLAFATEDMEGNEITSEDFKDKKLILVNYWEPWCGPCVSEMPDLEQLYEKYKDQGFMILGVFSAADMDEDAKSILADSGTTYPILRANRQFMPFMTGYYPTSFFVDGSGKVLSEDPIIGGQSYEEWEKYINSFLDNE